MANALANAGLFVSTAFWGGALALTISDNLISVSRVKNGVLRPVHEAAAAAQTPPGADAAAAAAAASRGAGVGGSGDGYVSSSSSSDASSASPASTAPAIANASASEPAGVDYVLVAREHAPRSQKLEVGDAVVFKSPHDPSACELKRLIATEGYWVRQKKGPRNTEVIRKGYCWVEGDDKDANGSDSRSYGQLPVGLIQGRALACLRFSASFPPVSMHFYDHY